jgi:hypothetical protein
MVTLDLIRDRLLVDKSIRVTVSITADIPISTLKSIKDDNALIQLINDRRKLPNSGTVITIEDYRII